MPNFDPNPQKISFIMPSTLIIGAGMAGLVAARDLVSQGWSVTLIDKGWNPGGRMATRRMNQVEEPAKADHGIPYVQPETPEFRQFIDQLVEEGIMETWPQSVGDSSTYIGTDGMNSVAKHLAQGLTIHTAEQVVRVGTIGSRWQAETKSGNLYRADTLLITVPAPQALALIGVSGLLISDNVRKRLEQISYQPCLAILALLNKPSQIPEPGVKVVGAGDTNHTTRLIDNGKKGISPNQPTITILKDAAFSQTHFDDNLTTVGQQVLDELHEWIPAGSVESFQVHRWRFSIPLQQVAGGYAEADTPIPLLFGGDGFFRHRLANWRNGLESAYWSGKSMAERLLAQETSKQPA